METKYNIDKQTVRVVNDIFTWANMLSFSRAFVAVPVIWLHHEYGNDAALYTASLIFYIILSDYLDGFLARKTNTISELGKIVDPLADKLSGAILFIYVTAIGVIPWWFFWFMISRDVIIGIGGSVIKILRGKTAMSVWPGKVGVNVLAIYWLIAFYAPDATKALYFFQGASFTMLLYAFHEYMQRTIAIYKGADYN